MAVKPGKPSIIQREVDICQANPPSELSTLAPTFSFLFDGKRIAKRGHGNWIMLVPGYRVFSSSDYGIISVEVLRATH